MENLEKHCGEKVDIGNLYRTLRRMESFSWVTSDWDKKETGADRRVYTITEDGREFLGEAVASLTQTDKLIHRFLKAYQENEQVNRK